VNPNAGNSDAGFDLSLRGTGVIVPVEISWLPGQEHGQTPNFYKIGAYYNFSKTPDVLKDVNGTPAAFTGSPSNGFPPGSSHP
jgi:porin